MRSLRVCSVVGNKLSDAVECKMLAAECLNIALDVAPEWRPNQVKNGAPNFPNLKKIGSQISLEPEKTKKQKTPEHRRGEHPTGSPLLY